MGGNALKCKDMSTFLSLVALFTTSCVTQSMIKISDEGLVNSEAGIIIRYETNTEHFSGKRWIVKNLTVSRDDPKLHGNLSGRYSVNLWFDLDSDGQSDLNFTKDRYDLLLENQQYNSKISIQSIPHGPGANNLDLDVLALEMLEGLAYSRAHAYNFSKNTSVIGRTYATKMISKKKFNFQGRPAIRMTIEIANVDQLKLNSKHRLEKLEIVIVKTGNLLKREEYSYKSGKKEKYNLPIFLYAIHAAVPRYFSKTEEDFADLLKRIEIR